MMSWSSLACKKRVMMSTVIVSISSNNPFFYYSKIVDIFINTHGFHPEGDGIREDQYYMNVGGLFPKMIQLRDYFKNLRLNG